MKISASCQFESTALLGSVDYTTIPSHSCVPISPWHLFPLPGTGGVTMCAAPCVAVTRAIPPSVTPALDFHPGSLGEITDCNLNAL